MPARARRPTSQREEAQVVPIKGGRYEYRPDSIVALRKQLGHTQAQMAKRLGIPANTLSRWETGATTPDATSLAALYSLGAAEGVQPQFFQRKRVSPKPRKGRSRLIVMWDLQNAAVSAQEAENRDAKIRGELDRRFSGSSYRLFKVFSAPSQERATDVLAERGWRVWEDYSDMDEELIAQAMSDCGHEPGETAFVLIANDGDYRDLIRDLKKQGVAVRVLALGRSPSKMLAGAVGKEGLIKIT